VAAQPPPGSRPHMRGPDYEEGPHSVMGEDEFYDAVDATLSALDEEEHLRERIRTRRSHQPEEEATPGSRHPLYAEIDPTTAEQLSYALQDVTAADSDWILFAEEGEMKLYRREVEKDGVVLDPCRALHRIRGVTAHEIAHHFWAPDVRFEWDLTLEQMTVVDTVDPDTLVFLQVHKRVWPVAQRDALFWSHIRRISPSDPLIAGISPAPDDTWIVCNRSTTHPDASDEGKCVRVELVVCFVCHTVIEPPLGEGETRETVSRDRLLTSVTYCSNMNPGGWVPAGVLRQIFKREYPRFLRTFTQYVVERCERRPVMWQGCAAEGARVMRGPA